MIILTRNSNQSLNQSRLDMFLCLLQQRTLCHRSFTDWMPFWSPNQQHLLSTEGDAKHWLYQIK